jgi:hypothetical protein
MLSMSSGWRSLLCVFAAVGLFNIVGCVSTARAAVGERISVLGAEFRAGGQRIWLNGANTPWHAWNDFGGHYDAGWWDKHFERLHENGINATRVWISCNGDVGINIDTNGLVTGCTPAFWSNVDSLLESADKHQVYIMATLLSFDHFSKHNTHHERWRRMLTDGGNIDAMVAHYVIPFVTRYKNNPWLWSTDLCNEPDWIHENASCGRISWDWIQMYVAKATVAIHTHSRILVTVGIAMGPKYQSSRRGVDVFSDAVLQAEAGGSPLAHLDFYSPHHYDWQTRIWGNPFSESPAAYGLEGGKPAVIGECPAKGMAGRSSVQDYEDAYLNGWQGVLGWTSNGVDANGGLENLGPATRAFRDHHPELVSCHKD